MEGIKVFSSEKFGQIRTVSIDNEPWFVGKDIAAALGYENSTKAVRDHVENEDKIMGVQNVTPSITDRMGRIQYPVWINEFGVYALIFSSKLESAKRFKHWVTSEVLSSIRKHGAYVTKSTAEKMLNNPDFAIMLLTELKKEREEKEAERQARMQTEHLNRKLDADNKALAGELLEWADRDKINSGMRMLEAVTGIGFGRLWNELYKNVEYKYHIYLNSRMQRDETKKQNASRLDYVRDNEWAKIMKSFCAMCEAYEKSPKDMMQQTTPKDKVSAAVG